jgi:hypothetical protein
VILDGVVDADHYVAPVWMDSIRDTDTIFNSFPKYCHEAKELCPLYRDGDELSDLEERFFGTLENLKTHPLVFSDTASKTPVIVTFSHIRAIFFSILYAPTYGFYSMAMFVDLIIQENFQVLSSIFSLPLVFDLYPNPGCEKPRPAWQ